MHVDVPFAARELLRLLGVNVTCPVIGFWAGLPRFDSHITTGAFLPGAAGPWDSPTGFP